MTGDSGVRFDRVGFAYPDAAAPVLHDITITIP
jgi:ABC-type multidrug transport system fused ATPase/permease subunit